MAAGGADRAVALPADLPFEDIADPADWALIMSAEQKTNPRIVEGIGALDMVPPERRVGGPGASYLMAPFTHASRDRPSRFSDGSFGLLYVGSTYEVALFETIHHHARFMAATLEAPGWTSQFREIRLDVDAKLHDIAAVADRAALLDPGDWSAGQGLGAQLRGAGSEGILYPSVRYPDGDCAALMYPDLAARPVQGRHLGYHWNGRRVDYVRDMTSGEVFAVEER